MGGRARLRAGVAGHPSALLMRAALRRRRVLTLVEALAVALSVALLCAAGLTLSSLVNAGSAERERLGAPDVLLTVWTHRSETAGPTVATGRTVARSLLASGLARSVDGPFPRGSGGLRGARRDLPATFTVMAGGSLPRWLDVLSGTAAARDFVAVERGAAQALGLKVGDRLTLTVASASVPTRIGALVGDLSVGDYSLSGTASAYVSPDLATSLGLDRSDDPVALGVHTAPGAEGRVRQAALAADPAVEDVDKWTIGAVGGPIVVLLSLVVGAVVLFGLAALVCTVIFLAGAARADVIVRERWVGRLRAVGWSVRGVRWLLLALHAPALLLGAAVGSGAGLLVAQRLVAALAPSFGFSSRLVGHPVWIWCAAVGGVLLVACGSLRGASRAIRRGVVADQLDSRSAQRAAVGGDSRRGGAVSRAVAALLWTRPSRTVVTVLLTAAGAWAIGIATLVGGTLQHAMGNPAFFGIEYDWSIDVPDTMTTQQVDDVLAALRKTPAISAAVPEMQLGARVAKGRAVKLRLLPAGQHVLQVPLVSGRLPASHREVVVATDLASSRGLHVGSQLLVTRSQHEVRVTVVGIKRDLLDLGRGVTGLPGLAADLTTDTAPTSLLLRRAEGVSLQQARDAAVAALHGRFVLEAARDRVTIPFADAFRALLVVLGGSLALLGGAIAAHLTATAAMEHRRAFAVFSALGVPPRMRRGMLGSVSWRLAVVPVVVGLVAGLGTGSWAVGAASSMAGGVDPVLPWWMVVLALAAALAGPLTGTVVPVRRALRTPPSALLGAGQT